MTGTDIAGGGPRTPIHLWIVGILTLLWNLMGAFDYLATQLQLDFYMSRFSQEQLAYFYAFPAWAISGWAIAVWSALAGSIFLLLRKKWALWAFVISFVGMIVSSIYTLGMSNGIEIMGAGAMYFSVVIWLVAIFLVVYACKQTKNGVLN